MFRSVRDFGSGVQRKMRRRSITCTAYWQATLHRVVVRWTPLAPSSAISGFVPTHVATIGLRNAVASDFARGRPFGYLEGLCFFGLCGLGVCANSVRLEECGTISGRQQRQKCLRSGEPRLQENP